MAGVVGAAVAGRVQGGSNESPAVAFTCVAESDSSATYVFRECDAAAFKGPRGELVGAPMKVVGSYILDHQVKNDSGQVTREAYIEVLPPRNLPFVPAAKQKMRRFNDRKTLTELGRQALARRHQKGNAWCGVGRVPDRNEVQWHLLVRYAGVDQGGDPLSPAGGVQRDHSASRGRGSADGCLLPCRFELAFAGPPVGPCTTPGAEGSEAAGGCG
jgi:hypothetical protein